MAQELSPTILLENLTFVPNIHGRQPVTTSWQPNALSWPPWVPACMHT